MDKNELVEKIINALREAGAPVQLFDLSKTLHIKSDSLDYQKLKSELRELSMLKIIERLSRRKFVLKEYDDNSIYKGVLKIRDDRAFVDIKPSGGQSDVQSEQNEIKKVYIKKKHLQTAFEGDTIQVKILGTGKGNKARGEVISILNRSTHIIRGIIEFDNNITYLLPDDDKYYVDFLIPKNKLNGAKHGERVKASFVSWDDRMKSPLAEVIEILKRKIAPTADFDSIIEEFYLPGDFKPNVIAEADEAAKPVSKEIINNRLDLRKELIITIDPVDAKDFDDALSLKLLENGNYELGVHIADVSHYIKENTNIDNEARWRGNSIYLVDRVIPMLPENLSNNMCSLQPNKVRLAYTVFMEFTSSGVLKKYALRESVIKSKKRFNYDEVDKILITGKGKKVRTEHCAVPTGEDPLTDLLLSLNKLAQTLREKRYSSGGIDFETSEVKFQIENGIPTSAVLKKSSPATILVEECMLAANQVVAKHVKVLSHNPPESPFKKGGKVLPFIYRIHDDPVQQKLGEVLEFLKTLRPSITLKGKKSSDINKFLERFDDLPEKPVVHQMLLRAMAKAVYSEKNIGHYGLGFSDYSHFTSPIFLSS
ncbi:MAG: ribonuclease R, partial [Bacteroidetes bacterium]|nr:ribonuclease R [Bacteroidota bacterium]